MKVLNDWDVLYLMHTHFAKQRSSVHVPNWKKFDVFSFLHLHLIVIVAYIYPIQKKSFCLFGGLYQLVAILMNWVSLCLELMSKNWELANCPEQCLAERMLKSKNHIMFFSFFFIFFI